MIWKYYEIEPQIRLQKLYSFFHVHYEEGYRFEGEMHNFWECMYVHTGRLVVSADERVTPLTEGGLIIHKPMELHRFYVDDPAGATITVFSFAAQGQGLAPLHNQVFSLNSSQRLQMEALLSLAEGKKQAGELDPSEKKYFKFLSPCCQDPVYGQ